MGRFSLVRAHLRSSNCKGVIVSSGAFLHHNYTQTDGFGWYVRFNPTPLVWRHLFWVLWPCFISTGHFGFDCISSIPLCTLQMLYIKAIYNKGKNMNTLHILAFLNMEETQPWSSNIFPLFLKTRCIYLHFLWSEINPLSISHECKD